MQNLPPELETDRYVEAAQVDALFVRAKFVLVTNIAIPIIAVTYLWPDVAASQLLSWLLAIIIITLSRFFLLDRYQCDKDKLLHLDYWKRVTFWGALASGLAWGSAALIIFPDTSLTEQVFILCMLVGMMAGSAVSWSAYFPAFMAFFIPVGTLTLARLAWEAWSGHDGHWIFAGLIPMLAIFCMALFAFARNSNQSFCLLLRATEKSIRSERYKSLFASAKITMMLIDPQDGRIVDANTVACEFYGYPEEQLRKMSVIDLQALPDGEVFPRDEDEVICQQLQQRTASGVIREVEVYSGAVQMADSRLLFYVVHDITERKELELKLRLGKLRLHAMLDNMPFMAWLKDTDGRYLSVNNLHALSTGLGHPANVIGKTDAQIWPAVLADKRRTDDIQVMYSRKKREEVTIGPDDGHWYQTVNVPVIDENDEVMGTAGYAQDITDRKRLEDSMLLAASIYQSSAEAIMVTDEDNLIVDVNPAFIRITGYTLEDIRGKDPNLLHSGRHDEEFYKQMWGAILTQGHWQGELWDRNKDGEICAKWVTITLIRRDDGSVLRHVAQFSDITEKKKQDELIWQQANFDTLTGLPNRRLFRDRLEQAIKKAHRADGLLALLFIDLDRFKQVNDTLGHDMGDVLLTEAARRITECVRETDTVARLGGDEFTVILPDFGDRAGLEKIAQHIIRQLSQPFMLKNENAYISASIGISLYPGGTPDADSLLRHADQAMYAAKAEGRGRFGYFAESMQHDAMEKFSLTNDLRQALTRNQLQVCYQPIVDLTNERIIKVEALLRWHHPVRGTINPDVFIPLAEESGLIVEIGDWVFRQAIADISRWKQKYGRIIPVGVNKSPLQFLEKSKGMSWPELLVQQGLPGNSIVVEITEGVLLKETAEVKRQLLEFRNHMIEVSIDDFGTGFSSLSYLKKFAIDYLKIERSFISSLCEDQNSRELTESIIAMAHKLDIRVIAEGVETAEQRDLLRKFGCDLAQGFLYSKAVPATALESLLESILQ